MNSELRSVSPEISDSPGPWEELSVYTELTALVAACLLTYERGISDRSMYGCVQNAMLMILCTNSLTFMAIIAVNIVWVSAHLHFRSPWSRPSVVIEYFSIVQTDHWTLTPEHERQISQENPPRNRRIWNTKNLEDKITWELYRWWS